MSVSPAETLATIVRNLLPASQETLVQFARFLKAQETAAAFDAVDEEDEAEWDRAFQDEATVASFTKQIDASLARSKPGPLNPSRL